MMLPTYISLPRLTHRLLAVFLATLLIGPRQGKSAEPLHVRIDQLIDASLLVPAAPAASDSEFLRRVSLDLCNRIATVDEARAFLKDTAPNKREALVDRLLASPQHARRLANFLDVSLM